MNLNVASYEDILSYSKEQPKYLKQLYDAFRCFDYHFKANNKVPKWINSGLATVWLPLQTILLLRTDSAEGPLIGPQPISLGR